MCLDEHIPKFKLHDQVCVGSSRQQEVSCASPQTFVWMNKNRHQHLMSCVLNVLNVVTIFQKKITFGLVYTV